MILRSFIGIALFATVSATAETNLHLERCSAGQLGLQEKLARWQTVTQEDVTSDIQRITLRKEILALKLDCLYHVLGEQLGGENTVIFQTIKNGKFKTAMDNLKNARFDLFREAQLDKIQSVCGKEIKDLLSNKCVMGNSDAAVVDLLATADALQELTLPTMLPIPSADLTVDQLRTGHVGLVKLPPLKSSK